MNLRNNPSNGTKIRVVRGTIGPKDDPYGFTVLTIHRFGAEFEITSCGLRGTKYEVNGEKSDFENNNLREAEIMDDFREDTELAFDRWLKIYEDMQAEEPAWI